MPWHQRPLLWHLLRRSRFSVEVLSAHTGAREGSQPSFGTPPVSHTGQGVFDKLVQVLVFGYAYGWASERSCSSTTLGHKRDVWIAARVMDLWIALEKAIIIGRLIHEAWTRYRWKGRSSRP
jgi:hypothetical protein